MTLINSLITKHRTVIYLLLGNTYLLLASLVKEYNTTTYTIGLTLLVMGLLSLKSKKEKKNKILIQKPLDDDEIFWRDIALTGWWATIIVFEVAIIVFYFFVVQNFLDGNHGWEMFKVWNS